MPLLSRYASQRVIMPANVTGIYSDPHSIAEALTGLPT
jgi:hypothetical protein